jgi:hypothetical protein
MRSDDISKTLADLRANIWKLNFVE